MFSFGDVYSGGEFIGFGAVEVRIYSRFSWQLLLNTTKNIAVSKGPAPRIPISRLSWRTPQFADFAPLLGGRPVTIATGGPTGVEGGTVVIDLKLILDEFDPLGQYATRVKVQLRSLHR